MNLRALNNNVENAAAVGDFLCLARAIVAGAGDIPQARAWAEGRRASPRVMEILRSAIAVGTTGDTSWAGALAPYQAAASAFLGSLSQASVFDRLLADGLTRAPLRTRVNVLTTGFTASAVNEAQVKPLTSAQLIAPPIDAVKSATITVVTDEIARFASPAALALFRAELTKAVARSTDAVFLAGLLAGVTPTPSAGSTAANIMTDLGALLGAVTITPSTRLLYVADVATMKRAALKVGSGGNFLFPRLGPTGGELLPGVEAVATDQLPAGVVLLIAADQIIGDSETIVLDASEQAILQYMTAPDSPPTASTVLISLWQHGHKALKSERYFGWFARSGAVAALSGVSY